MRWNIDSRSLASPALPEQPAEWVVQTFLFDFQRENRAHDCRCEPLNRHAHVLRQRKQFVGQTAFAYLRPRQYPAGIAVEIVPREPQHGGNSFAGEPHREQQRSPPIGGGKAVAAFNATVDLLRKEHLETARESVRDPKILKELEDEIEKDCEWLRGFLFAAHVSQANAVFKSL